MMILLQSNRFPDILLYILIIILLSLVFSESNPDVQFLSRGQSFVRYAGQSVEMDCEFYAEALDMFQHHIIWYKSQQQQQQQQKRADEGGWGGGKILEGESGWKGKGRASEGSIGVRRGQREGGRQWRGGERGGEGEGGRGGGGWTEEDAQASGGRRDGRRGGRGDWKEGGAWGRERWVDEEDGEEDGEEVVWSDGGDRMQVNLMGALLEPFASTGRYRVNLSQQPPTYRLRLLLTDLTPEDTGSFSCHVNSVDDAEAEETPATSITHALHVRAPVDMIRLSVDLSTLSNLSNFVETSFNEAEGKDGPHSTSNRQGTLTVTHGRLNTVGCIVRGGYPPPDVEVYDGQREVTNLFTLMRVFRYEGPKGLRTLRYVSARWSEQFQATENDNGKVIKCEAVVDGLTPYTTSSRLNVQFVPVVTCRWIWSLVGERNVFVSCQVRSNPNVSNVVWTFEDNGTTVISTPDDHTAANDQYWTVVKTQLIDFRIEVRLYIRQVRHEHFRCYRLMAENSLGRTSSVVQLLQRSRPFDRTTNPISFDARKDELAADEDADRIQHQQQQPSLHKSLLRHVNNSNGVSSLPTKRLHAILSVFLLLAFLTTSCLQRTQHSV